MELIFLYSKYLAKNALKYETFYEQKLGSATRNYNETECNGCGKVISQEIFRETDKSYVEYVEFLGGCYYCKNCFRKLAFKFINFSVLIIIITLALFFGYFQLFGNQMDMYRLNGFFSNLTFSIVLFLILFQLSLFLYVTELRKYK